MSLARAISRGAFLKARLGVNGTQKAARSLGTVAATSRVSASDIESLLEFFGRLFRLSSRLAENRRAGNGGREHYHAEEVSTCASKVGFGGRHRGPKHDRLELKENFENSSDRKFDPLMRSSSSRSGFRECTQKKSPDRGASTIR